MCSFYFSSIWVAKWSPIWKELLTRLIICSFFIVNLFVILVISRFGFEGWIWVLIASIPGLFIHTCITLK